jgi:hypothetical protein
VAEKTLRNEFKTALFGGEPGLIIHSDEHEDAISTMAKVVQKLRWKLISWDCSNGLDELDGEIVLKAPSNVAKGVSGSLQQQDGSQFKAPLVALTAFHDLAPIGQQSFSDEDADTDDVDDEDQTPVIFIARNLHLALGIERGPARDALIQIIQHILHKGKSDSKFFVLLVPPGVKLCDELRPLFMPIEHELPNRKEHEEILSNIVGKGNKTAASDLEADELDKVLDASRGLTRLQAEGVYGRSKVPRGQDRLHQQLGGQGRGRFCRDRR